MNQREQIWVEHLDKYTGEMQAILKDRKTFLESVGQNQKLKANSVINILESSGS